MSAVSHDYLFEQTPFGTDTEQSYRTQFQSEEAVNGLGSVVRINLNSVQNGFINTHNSFLNLSFKIKSFKGTNIVTGTGTGETPVTNNIRMSWIGAMAMFDQINVIGAGTGYISQQQNQQAINAVNMMANTDFANAGPNSITNLSAPPHQGVDVTIKSLLGHSLPLGDAANATVNSTTTTTCSPSIQGVLSGAKSIPLTWFKKDTVLELFVTNDIRNFLFNANAAGTISAQDQVLELTVNFDCQIDVVSDASLRAVEAHAGGRPNIVSWSDTQQTASQHSLRPDELDMPSSFLKTNVIAGRRPRKLLSVIQSGFRRNSTGNRDPWECCNPYLNGHDRGEWFIRIGGINFPPRALSGIGEHTQEMLSCYNQYSNTILHNRLTVNFSEPRLPDDVTKKININRNAVGVDLTQFDVSADGINTSGVIIESHGTLEKYIKYDATGVALATQPAATTQAMQVYTILRMGVLYSIDASGDWSISY